MATPFDPERQQVTGPSVAVLEGVRRSFTTNVSQFSVADNGSLAYLPGAGGPSSARRNRLVVASLKGEITHLPMPPGPSYEFPRYSLDGKQVTYGTDDGTSADIWIYDLSSTSAARARHGRGVPFDPFRGPVFRGRAVHLGPRHARRNRVYRRFDAPAVL